MKVAHNCNCIEIVIGLVHINLSAYKTRLVIFLHFRVAPFLLVIIACILYIRNLISDEEATSVVVRVPHGKGLCTCLVPFALTPLVAFAPTSRTPYIDHNFSEKTGQHDYLQDTSASPAFLTERLALHVS